jgi:two-component sensor histidine kinase
MFSLTSMIDNMVEDRQAIPGDILDMNTTVLGTAPWSRGTMAKVLFDATCPLPCSIPPESESIRMLEASNRISNLLHLIVALERKSWRDGDADERAPADCAQANMIAAYFRSLDIARDAKLIPCTETLRGLITGLVELFGPTVGVIELKTDLQGLTLPVHRRRALVLATCEMVTAALRYGFRQRNRGKITVTLARDDSSSGRLLVEDDGSGLGVARGDSNIPVIGGLAKILGAEFLYWQSPEGGLASELTFAI